MKTMQLKNVATLSFMGLCLFLSSCSFDTLDSKDVNEDKLYGHYSAEYDAQKNEMEFYTRLAAGGFSGTTIRANLAVDGQAMKERNFLGATSYRLTLPRTGGPDATYTFTWTRLDGTAYHNSVTIPRRTTIASPGEGQVISRKGDLEVRTNAVLGDNEKLEVSLTTEEKDTGAQDGVLMIIVKRNERLIFPKHRLQNFAKGNATIQIERIRTYRDPKGHEIEGGLLQSSYKSRKRRIRIGE